jgi:hypothetical protein
MMWTKTAVPCRCSSRQLPDHDRMARGKFPIMSQEKLETALGDFDPDRDVVTCTRKAGTVIFADTAALYHRGKPASARDRCAIFFNYMNRAPLRPFSCERSTISRAQTRRLAASVPQRQRSTRRTYPSYCSFSAMVRSDGLITVAPMAVWICRMDFRTASRKLLAFSIKCHRSPTWIACGSARCVATAQPPPQSRARTQICECCANQASAVAALDRTTARSSHAVQGRRPACRPGDYGTRPSRRCRQSKAAERFVVDVGAPCAAACHCSARR